jgi:hypothetical protein
LSTAHKTQCFYQKRKKITKMPSENYFSNDELRKLDAREDMTISKASQQRSCVACGLPVDDAKAESISIGGGLVVLVHAACKHELVSAMAPQEVRIPVPAPSVRKSTVTQPYAYDQERMARDIKAEVYQRLLEIGLRQGQ